MVEHNAYTTMAEAIDGLKRRGFTQDFEFLGQEFRAVGIDRAYRPEDLTIVEHHRFEGVSDPDDLAIVYAIEAHDGTRGVLGDAYGPYADPGLAAFLKAVPIRVAL